MCVIYIKPVVNFTNNILRKYSNAVENSIFQIIYCFLDKGNGIENCRCAMDIAQKDLGIPAVLEPEYLASPWLDELSGMTYLSYFMKPGSPGFHATLRWVNSRMERPVQNFTVREVCFRTKIRT